MNEAHPYIPPLPPKQTIEKMSAFSATENHRLEGGAKTIKIGDSINIDTKYIVRKTIVTEDSDVIEVELEKVSQGVWRKN